MSSQRRSPLRHRLKPAITAAAKTNGIWQTDTGPLADATGGLLAQSLAYVASPSSDLLECTGPSYGLDLPLVGAAETVLLNALGPNYGAVLWCSAGSLANELMIWTAVRRLEASDVPVRGLIVSEGAYHGNSELTRLISRRVPASVLPLWQSRLPIITAPRDVGRDGDLMAEWIRDQVDGDGSGWILLIEPRSTTGENFPWTVDRLATLIERSRELGCIVLCDEIASGMYRHGSLTSYGAASPHAITLSKGLTQGRWPLAAAVLGPELEQVVRTRGPNHLRGFTSGLTPAAAHYLLATLQAMSDLLDDKWLVQRHSMLDRVVTDGARQTDLAMDMSPTTLRIRGNPEKIGSIARCLSEQRVWAYVATTIADGERIQHLHFCPMFDLAIDEQQRLFKALSAAIRSSER